MIENSNESKQILRIAQANIQKTSRFSSKRSFKCPPGMMYSVFKTTSAGPEFIDSYAPNDSGKLDTDEILYRIPIGGAPIRYLCHQSYRFTDGTIIELEIELFIEIIDGATVTRLVIQDRYDPLQDLQTDIRWLLDAKMGGLQYDTVFYPETKKIRLDRKSYATEIEQKIECNNYGLKIDKVRIGLILPPDLKKRWENDIATWQDKAENGQVKVDKQKAKLNIKKQTEQLNIEEKKLDANTEEVSQDIERKKEEKQTQYNWATEDKKRERENRIARENKETEHTNNMYDEQAKIDIKNIQQESDIKTQYKTLDAELKRKKLEDTFEHQKLLEKEHQDILIKEKKEAAERHQQVKDLQHKTNISSLQSEIKSKERNEKRQDKIHELELKKLEKLSNLWFERQDLSIEEQKQKQEQRLLTDKKQAELENKHLELDYEKKKSENELILQERQAMLEMKKNLINTRIGILERLSRENIELTTEQINQLMGLDPTNGQGITKEQIGGFIESVNEYLKEDGKEKILEAWNEFTNSDGMPLLTESKAKETKVIEADTSNEDNTQPSTSNNSKSSS